MKGLVSDIGYGLIRLGTPTVSQMFGGAPLAQEVGDTLAAHGISLITLYGWYAPLCHGRGCTELRISA